MWPDHEPVPPERLTRQAEAVEAEQPAQGLRLPALREPVGWRSLSDAELGVRVMLLWDAVQSVPVPVTTSSVDPVSESAAPKAHREPDAGLLSSVPAPNSWALWGRVGLGLPWLLVVAGMAMTLPVLLWAPMVGGLCLGALALQVHIVRRWARQRWADAPDTGPAPSGALAHPRSAPGGVRPGHPRMPSGLMLFASLALTGMLAAVLLTTLHIKSREPAAAAEAMRLQRQLEASPEATSGVWPRALGNRSLADPVPADQPATEQPPVKQP